MDPLLFGIATNLAADLLQTTYSRLRDIGLGDGETRALRQASIRALGVLAVDIVQAQQSAPTLALTPDLVSLVEGQLRRLVTDAEMAEMLVVAALEERGPDHARLRARFEELGFDLRTFLIDFDAAMSRFRYALADELVQTASTAGSPLFNRVVLAQLAAVRDQLAHLAGRSSVRPPGPPAGRPIREWTDPFALEVHRAIDGGPDLLPRYVPREHDDRLGIVLAEAMDGHSVMRVLVGGSSAGKTRACWEALRRLPDSWRLWHPISPSPSAALLAGLHTVTPRTVLWLNDLQLFLLVDPNTGEQVAAGLRELLRDPDRAPVLILGTAWPEYWRLLTVTTDGDSRDGPAGPRPQTQNLLAGTVEVVPESFTGPDRERAAQAARFDARLNDAREHARDGKITQFLAGGLAQLGHYRTASAVAKAVIEAAMDARRLGHHPDLSRDLLRDAAPGYLTDRDRATLAADWFEEALSEAGQPWRGISGPVAAYPGVDSPTVFRLADYLDHWAHQARATELVPASTWEALRQHSAESDLPTLAQEADRRHLYRRAVDLYRPAATAGDVEALRVSAHYLAVVGEVDEALALYGRAADTGYPLALEDAAQALADLGLVDTSLTWWRMTADADTGFRGHYAGICAARSLARAGRLDEALQWWDRATDPNHELTWYNSTLRLRCWTDHRIPRGVLDWTVQYPFGNTGAQLALLDAARALHRAGRTAEAMRWYERAADVEQSHVVSRYRRLDPGSDEVHRLADWLSQQMDSRSERAPTDPAKVFYEVARKGGALAVVHGAQALAETGDPPATMRWLMDHISDDGSVVTVAAQVFDLAGRAAQAIEWIQHDESDLAARVRAGAWAEAFNEAQRYGHRSGRLTFVGALDNTRGAEMFDVLEPRGTPLAALTDIASEHRAAGRIEEAVHVYLHSAECGEQGFSEAVELLRSAGRDEDAERLARFGLEPGGLIGHHPGGDLEPPPGMTDETDGTDELVGILRRRWRSGGNVVGDAVLRAAVDILRCGYRGLLPADLLATVASVILADLGIPAMGSEELRPALVWACEPVANDTAALRRFEDGYQLLSPLFDAVLAEHDCPPVRETVWRAVAEHAAPEECWSVAQAAHEAGWPELAEFAARRAAEHGDPLGMYVLSRVLGGRGHDDEAARWLHAAAEAGESNAQRLLADEAAAQGRTGEAIARYRQADDWPANSNLGALLFREGRLAEAEEAFRRAVPDGPPAAAHNLAVTLHALGRTTEAEIFFAQAVADGHVPAVASHARVLSELGRSEEAESCYVSAIGHGAIHLAADYGDLLEQQGRLGAARRLYRQAVDLNEFSVASRLAKWLDEQGKTVLLADLLRRGVAADDNYCKNRLAILLVEDGELDQAEALYRDAIAGGFLLARNNLALLLERRGQPDEAEELLRAAAAHDDATALNNLGRLLCQQQRLDEAEPFLVRAIAAGDLNAVNNLGLLKQARGLRAEAERLFRRAAENGNRQAPANLSQLLSEGEPDPTEP